MARIANYKEVKTGAGVALYFSFQIPKGAKLLKVDVCNLTEAGTNWSAELSTEKDTVGGIQGASLIHHEIQGLANKNVTWEASARWTINPPMNWIVIVADTVVTNGSLLSVCIIYELP